jgi:hypothetical protein
VRKLLRRCVSTVLRLRNSSWAISGWCGGRRRGAPHPARAGARTDRTPRQRRRDRPRAHLDGRAVPLEALGRTPQTDPQVVVEVLYTIWVSTLYGTTDASVAS